LLHRLGCDPGRYRIRENGTRRLASGYLPENVDDAIGASSAGWKRDAVFEPGVAGTRLAQPVQFGVGMWAANLHALPATRFPSRWSQRFMDSWVRRAIGGVLFNTLVGTLSTKGLYWAVFASLAMLQAARRCRALAVDAERH